MKTIKLFILIIIICSGNKIFCQNTFDFKIVIKNSNYDSNKLKISFYKGYDITPISLNKEELICKTLFSRLKYPILEFFYFSSKSKPIVLRFFLLNKKSKIIISYDKIKDGFKFEQGYGVSFFNNVGQNDFNKFAKKEISTLDSFENKNNYNFITFDSLTINKLTNYTNSLRNKGIDFIKLNPKSLFSLWYFINEIIGKPNYSLEYLSKIYTKSLEPYFKNSFEHKFILDQLNKNRLAINTIAPGQDIYFKDLNDNIHKLKDFNGKPLIIMIWASWCVPCVAEIPELVQLYSKYKEKIGLVSFSTDRDVNKLKDFVIKYNMNWINVYGKYDLCNIYGSDKSIPQVYLIDKNGSIVYSRSIYQDYDLFKLGDILRQMLN